MTALASRSSSPESTSPGHQTLLFLSVVYCVDVLLVVWVMVDVELYFDGEWGLRVVQV